MENFNKYSIFCGVILSVYIIINAVSNPKVNIFGSIIWCALAMTCLSSKHISKYAGHYYFAKKGIIHQKDHAQLPWKVGVILGWLLFSPVLIIEILKYLN